MSTVTSTRHSKASIADSHRGDDVSIPVEGLLSANQTRVQPLQIVFRNLTYSVTVKNSPTTPANKYEPVTDQVDSNAAPPPPKSKFSLFGRGKRENQKVILQGLTGAFQPGRLAAVLGPSGSGKTSLINILAGSVRAGRIDGDLLLNGRRVTGDAIRRVSGYIHQDDVILATMTVEEAITMSATMRCPNLTPAERQQRVHEVIGLLELEKARHTVIGNTIIKGVSGGERKRCAIAMELVSNPSVLFLDEPTSGLDAYTAVTVTYILRELARSGRTVVTVMHQPSSEIFHMFDDIMVLQEGRTVYMGEASHAVDYFTRVGYRCPTYTNPADFFFMSVLYQFDPENLRADNKEELVLAESSRLDEVSTFWKNSPEAAQYEHIATHPLTRPITQEMLNQKSTFAVQFAILFRRAGRNVLRNKMVAQVKVMQAIFFGIFIGLIYLNIPGKDTLNAVTQDLSGALFFVAVNQFFSNAMPIITVFAEERQVFEREHQNGLYSLPAYFFSKNAIEVPFVIFTPSLFSVITYWMFGLQEDAGKFFIYLAVAVCVGFCGVGFGTLMACAFDNLQVTMVVTPLIILPLMIFGGLFVNSGSAPVYLGWIQWISPIKYGFSALAINQYTGFEYNGEEVGSKALDNLALGPFGILVNIVFLIVLFTVLYVFSYLALWRLVSRTKGDKSLRSKVSPKKQLLAPPLPEFPENNGDASMLAADVTATEPGSYSQGTLRGTTTALTASSPLNGASEKNQVTDNRSS
ncbi:hypothetical protein H4R34_003081 [Dimargaris verticillata]|uniref:ABC transporter domain-containing protein n=1 Tax=Dimargaris verticillata TaxID=2761393 RepID=A0A9W8B2T5_9FUNG|nr:hypothetical protein H4R34_003081 [Dimargaris verticillata]